MEAFSQATNVLAYLLVGALIYSAVYYVVNYVQALPKRFYWLGLVFFLVVALDNITATGWAIADHYEKVFHFNWWSSLQWFPLSEVSNTAPAGNPDGLTALRILFDGFWSQHLGDLVVVYLWWSVQALLYAALARFVYRWLERKLA